MPLWRMEMTLDEICKQERIINHTLPHGILKMIRLKQKHETLSIEEFEKLEEVVKLRNQIKVATEKLDQLKHLKENMEQK